MARAYRSAQQRNEDGCQEEDHQEGYREDHQEVQEGLRLRPFDEMRGRVFGPATHFAYLETMMENALTQYRKLQAELTDLGKKGHGLSSPIVNSVLDRMEKLWWDLSDEEQELISADGSQGWLEGGK
jgi:hypothetical protein